MENMEWFRTLPGRQFPHPGMGKYLYAGFFQVSTSLRQMQHIPQDTLADDRIRSVIQESSPKRFNLRSGKNGTFHMLQL
jgi:hypothetical protein